MFTWGILSGAMAFIGGETGFYVVRLLLGAAEAGFFPGIIFYLTLWFPASHRARIISLFMAAIPLSSVIGAPVSGALLGMDGVAGLKGWQWLFLLEAAPALILSVITFFYLTDRPADAHWLAADERDWLARRLESERRQRETVRQYSVKDALTNPRVLAIAVVYFGAVAVNYGLSFFLPQIVKAFGVTNLETGFITLIPYAIGTVGMVWWGRRSDAKGERKGHLVVALLLASAGIATSTFIDDPFAKMVLISVGAFGVFSALPLIWTLPTAFLSGAAAAGGIAIINALGNLSGFFGPYVVGYIKDQTGSFTGGLLAIAAAGAVAMVVVLLMRHDGALERVSDGPASGAARSS